jgi:hypothetical protein
VCVRDHDSGRTWCGEVSKRDLPERLDSVEVGGCAYIKVERDAALELERRPCSRALIEQSARGGPSGWLGP